MDYMAKKNTDRRSKNLNIRADFATWLEQYQLDVRMDRRVQQYVLDAAIELFRQLPRGEQDSLVLRQMMGDAASELPEPPPSVAAIGPNEAKSPESGRPAPPSSPPRSPTDKQSRRGRGRRK